ncbi:NHLP-related RiPP peptide [Stenotrophomonas sp.]|uniref:NHLP-related RiPP peptide n=1 Tax=Stenotrophomonas sp. TaxID=69392 RepID=UPI0028A7ED31|nr:NHLP-related RiPP peptide [Stenotrophomonas sp.]
MNSSNEEKVAHPPLPDTIANHLLDLLANDDAFRAVFAADPHAALIAAGLTDKQADAALLGPSCLRVSSLASKEAIADARDRLKHSLTSEGAHTVVFCFDDKA